jgi:hypothetical protein
MISITSSAKSLGASTYFFFVGFDFGLLFGRFPPTTEIDHGGFLFVSNVQGSIGITDT